MKLAQASLLLAACVASIAAWAQSASLAADPLDFGVQSVKTTSQPRTAVLRNDGGAPASVTAVTVGGPFQLDSHACTAVAPGSSCAATVTFTPQAAGPASGTLTFQTPAGALQVALSGTGEQGLVTHYYQSILGRTPDAGGKAFWEGESSRVGSLGAHPNEVWYAMSMSFFTSAEYAARGRDGAGYVGDLYRTFFNRPPDAAGLAFWSSQLDAGVPREAVLVSFLFSAEFIAFTQGISGAAPVRAEIDAVLDFYRGLLSRLPDSGGFTHWRDRFRVAQCQGAAGVSAAVDAISVEFVGSGEYIVRGRSNAQYVADLYNAFLRRGGDRDGVLFWINQLNSGARTRDSLRLEFLSSPEFSARINAVIAQGCLPGTCPLSVSPASGADWGNGGGSGSFAVSTPAGCGWNATTSSFWLDVDGAPRSGAGTVAYTVEPNGGGARSGSIVIRPVDTTVTARGFPVRQSGAPAQPTMTWNLSRSCNNGERLEFRFFDRANNWVWPEPGLVYLINAGETPRAVLQCKAGATICIGGRSTSYYWGVDIDDSKGCSDCCGSCGSAVSWNFACGTSPQPPTNPCFAIGMCQSNGVCCPRGYVGCNGGCYTSPTAAYSATLNPACLSATTLCPP